MEIIPKIHQFNGMNNCYLIEDEEMMLIDTGNPGNSKKNNKLRKKHFKP
jgi:flavorubredoxin